MGIELLGFCHQFHGPANVANTVLGKVLEGNLTAIGIEVHAVIGSGVAVSGQRVVSAAGIVAGTFAGIGS